MRAPCRGLDQRLDRGTPGGLQHPALGHQHIDEGGGGDVEDRVEGLDPRGRDAPPGKRQEFLGGALLDGDGPPSGVLGSMVETGATTMKRSPWARAASARA